MMDLTPLYMSCIAGMSTCLGAFIVFFQPNQALHNGTTNHNKRKAISSYTMVYSLALAGSVMVTVCVVSIIPECLRDHSLSEAPSYKMLPLLSSEFGERFFSFSLGCFLYYLLSKVAFPEPDEILGLEASVVLPLASSMITTATTTEIESHELKQLDNNAINNNSSRSSSCALDNTTNNIMSESVSSPSPNTRNRKCKKIPKNIVGLPNIANGEQKKNSRFHRWKNFTAGKDLATGEERRAWRVAMLLFISLAFHNFPEGLAVAASVVESEKLGITVTIGIMIHNIPEGIAIAIPCLVARPNNPWLAFWLATLSGLAEPIGAFVALLFIGDGGKDSNFKLDNILAFVAGIMIMVSVIELFPEALRHNKKEKDSSFLAGSISGIIIMVATELYL